MPKVNQKNIESNAAAVAPQDWTAAMLEGLSVKAILKLVGEKAGAAEQLALKKSARRGKAKFAQKVVKRMQNKYVESPATSTTVPTASSSSNRKRARSPEALGVATASTSASQEGLETEPPALVILETEELDYVDPIAHEPAGSTIKKIEIEERVRVEARVEVTIKTEDSAEAEEVEYIDLTTELDAVPANRHNPERYYFTGFHEPVRGMYFPGGPPAHVAAFEMDHRYTLDYDDFEEALIDDALLDDYYEELDARRNAQWISTTPLGRRRREDFDEDDDEGVFRGAPRARLAQLGLRSTHWANVPSFPTW